MTFNKFQNLNLNPVLLALRPSNHIKRKQFAFKIQLPQAPYKLITAHTHDFKVLNFKIVLNNPLASYNRESKIQWKRSVFTLTKNFIIKKRKKKKKRQSSHQFGRLSNNRLPAVLPTLLPAFKYLRCRSNFQFHSFLGICKSYLRAMLLGPQPHEILFFPHSKRGWGVVKELIANAGV